MSSRKLALTSSALLIIAASVAALSGGNANASTLASARTSTVPASTTTSKPHAIVPQTAYGCVNTAFGDPPQVCFAVYGSGLYVDSFNMTLAAGYQVGKFKVVRPGGAYWLSPLMNVEGGSNYWFTINSYEPAGNYWGYFEVENPNGSYTQTAGAYVTVHS